MQNSKNRKSKQNLARQTLRKGTTAISPSEAEIMHTLNLELANSFPEEKIIRMSIEDASQGLPDPDTSSLSLSEKRIRTHYLNKHHIVSGKVDQRRNQLNMRGKRYTTEHARLTEALKKDSVLNEDTQACVSIQTQHNKKLSKILDDRAAINEELAPLDKEMDKLLQTQGKAPLKQFYDFGVVYGLSLSGLIGTEAALNYSSLQDLGLFSNVNGVFITGGISVALGIGAHTLGSALNFKNGKDKVSFGLSLLSSIGIFSVIGYLRADKPVLTILVVAAYLIGVLLAYKRSVNRSFFKLRKQLHKLNAKLRWLDQQEDALDKWQASEIEKIADDAQHTQEEQIAQQETDKQALEAHIEGIETSLIALDKLSHHVSQRISDAYIEAVMLYRTTHQARCQKLNKPTVTFWQEDQPHLLDDDDDPNEPTVPEEPVPPPAPKKTDSSSKGNFFTEQAQAYLNNLAGVIILLFSLGLIGCSNNTKQVDGFASIDLTDSALVNEIQSSEIIGEHISSYYFQEGSTESNFGTVYIGTIEESSLTHLQHISLEKGAGYLLRTEAKHKEQLQSFKTNITRSLDSVLQLQQTHHQTQLYRHLCECSYRFSRSQADTRFIILFSDLIEYSPKANFFRFRYDPDKLMESYDKIVETLEADCQVNLQGVEITIVQLPHPNAELALASQKFWRRFLSSKNVGQIEIVANL